MPDDIGDPIVAYEATQGGTWPDGSDFAAGDRVTRIPASDERWLLERGVFVPVRASQALAEDAAKRAEAPTNKRARPAANKGAAHASD